MILLTLLNWTDTNGQKHRLEIIQTVNAKWRTTGLLLGQSVGDLDGYQQRGGSIDDCCSRVFDRWINNNGSPEYPLSWASLVNLLRDVQHGAAADSLKRGTLQQGSCYHQRQKRFFPLPKRSIGESTNDP